MDNPTDEPTDPYRWLEALPGEAKETDPAAEKALDWVRDRNAETFAAYTESAEFTALRDEIRTVLDADDRIPYVTQRAGLLYNFWQDAANPRGLWRRTTAESYRSDDPKWEVLLDVDALAAAEDEAWVWHGADFLEPEYRRCLVSLSRGGADASVVREFDVATRSFVATDPFALPEAKSSVEWIDQDTLFVGTDFGAGSLTDSGYPRLVKVWRRGTPLTDATTVFEGEQTDVAVGAAHDPETGRRFVTRSVDFYHQHVFQLTDTGVRRIDVPDDASVSTRREWLLVELRSDWDLDGVVHPAGSLLAARFDGFLAGDRTVEALFTPDDRSALVGYSWTQHTLILNILADVRSRLELRTPAPAGWRTEAAPDVPELGSINVLSTDHYYGDEYLLAVDSYLDPPALLRAEAGQAGTEVLKRSPARFDATGLAVAQWHATSADGTSVPYFVVGPAAAIDGSGQSQFPTLLYGYGGFEISLLPGYAGVVGLAWLARGGVYVVANLRGGGEFGPRWHQAALRENRPRAYEDMAAVAADLVARGVTVPARLGVEGGSNGGLMTGNMLVSYPELFGAVVSAVPLLDLRRYHQMLAGASWMAEYGDPDVPSDWEFMRGFSPYQLASADRGYPPVLFTTSTRDDRVHPGHARKMVARLLEQGHQGVSYYENIVGGHGGATTNDERAFKEALTYRFLRTRLG